MKRTKKSKLLSRVIAGILASASFFSSSLVIDTIINKSIQTHAWSFWPFGHTQEEIEALQQSINALLESCNENAKKLNNVDKCSNFLKQINEIQAEEKKFEKSYENLVEVFEKADSLFKNINIALDIQEIENRQKQEKETFEKQKLEEELQRKLKEQRQEEERIEIERLEKLNNSKDKLSGRVDLLLRDSSKRIKNDNEIAKLNDRALELKEKINSTTSIGQVEIIEVFVNDFQDEINAIVEAEAKAIKGAFEKLLKEAKENFTKRVDQLLTKLEDVDKQNEEFDEITHAIQKVRNWIENLQDLDHCRDIDAGIDIISDGIDKVIQEQIRLEAERKMMAEQEARIDDQRDFEKQLEFLRDGKINIEDVIGGNTKAKNKLNALVNSFAKYKKGSKIKPAKGILLYGPPGTGKTTLARAMAAYRNLETIMVTPSMLMDVDGPQKVSQLVDLAKKNAKISGKLTVFIIDEIDAIAQIRSNSGSDKVLVSLMNSIDKLNPDDGVMIFATTNRREALDTAIVRSGRLDQSVEVGYPSAEDIVKILNIRLKFLTLEKNIDFNALAAKMKRFNGADVGKVVEVALSISAERYQTEELSRAIISKSDLEKGITTVIDEKLDFVLN